MKAQPHHLCVWLRVKLSLKRFLSFLRVQQRRSQSAGCSNGKLGALYERALEAFVPTLCPNLPSSRCLPSASLPLYTLSFLISLTTKSREKNVLEFFHDFVLDG